jgi:hypothetical protein
MERNAPDPCRARRGRRPLVKRLLSTEHPNDPAATESLRACAVIAELADSAEDLGPHAERVMTSVVRRLTSSTSSVAFEATRAILPLARRESKLVAALVAPHLHHTQSWTRVTALRLSLATDEPALDAIEEYIDTLQPLRTTLRFGGLREGRGPSPSKSRLPMFYAEAMSSEVVQEGIRALVRMRPGSGTVERLRRVARENVAGRMASAIATDLLRSAGSRNQRSRGPSQWGCIG